MDFPPISEFYADEFGEIDPEIYEAGRILWNKSARHFAERFLSDSDEGCRLMMKAVADVSLFRKENSSGINNLNAYLFKSFKNLIFAKLRKRKRRREILDGLSEDVQRAGEEDRIFQRLAAGEALESFSDWEREVFELHYVLGYTYEEIAPKYDMKANFLRKKMSEAVHRVKKKYEEN